jgi:hypothetical protein
VKNTKCRKEIDTESTNPKPHRRGILANKNLLKCRLINARSVINKIDDLRVIANTENLDIICITESWANNNVADAELSIPGYNITRNDRENKRGGGILLY